MSMHLEGPWLTTTGKKKGKTKWRSAEEKRKYQELEQSWNQLKVKHNIQEEQKRSRAMKAPTYVPPKLFIRDTSHIPSLNRGVDNGIASRKDNKVYTGTKIIGIGTLHKSNAVPIFSNEEAVDISKMRR